MFNITRVLRAYLTTLIEMYLSLGRSKFWWSMPIVFFLQLLLIPWLLIAALIGAPYRLAARYRNYKEAERQRVLNEVGDTLYPLW